MQEDVEPDLPNNPFDAPPEDAMTPLLQDEMEPQVPEPSYGDEGASYADSEMSAEDSDEYVTYDEEEVAEERMRQQEFEEHLSRSHINWVRKLKMQQSSPTHHQVPEPSYEYPQPSYGDEEASYEDSEMSSEDSDEDPVDEEPEASWEQFEELNDLIQAAKASSPSYQEAKSAEGEDADDEGPFSENEDISFLPEVPSSEDEEISFLEEGPSSENEEVDVETSNDTSNSELYEVRQVLDHPVDITELTGRVPRFTVDYATRVEIMDEVLRSGGYISNALWNTMEKGGPVYMWPKYSSLSHKNLVRMLKTQQSSSTPHQVQEPSYEYPQSSYEDEEASYEDPEMSSQDSVEDMGDQEGPLVRSL